MRILIYTLFAIQILNAQTFREAFDDMDVITQTFSSDPDAADLEAYAHGTIRGYLYMYRATGDIYYLNKTIYHTKKMQDMRGYYAPGGAGFFCPFSNPKTWAYSSLEEHPCWSQAYTNFLIMYPMAEFIYLVEVEEPSLSTKLIPTSINITGVSTYADYASWLKIRLEETIAEFDNGSFSYIDDWDTHPSYPNDVNYTGYYKSVGNEIAAINKQAACGLTLLYMSQVGSTSSLRSNYLGKVTILAQQFRNVLFNANSNTAYYSGHFQPQHTFGKEDISHANQCIQFAQLCIDLNLTILGVPFYSDTDMKKYASTMNNIVYKKPLDFYSTLYGDYDDEVKDPDLTVEQIRIAASRWAHLSYLTTGTTPDGVGRDIYHHAGNVMFDIIKNDWGTHPNRLEVLALLTYYQNIFDYEAYSKLPGPDVDWSGVEGGNFDGVGNDEFVTFSNFSGDIYIYEVQNNDVVYVASNSAPGASSDWVDVATGDFKNNGKDQFVAARNYDGAIFIYELNGSTISQVTSDNSFSASYDWAGVAAGNFKNNGKDQYVLMSQTDGAMYMYELVNGVITLVDDDHTPGSSIDWAGVTAGDFDGDGIDEFVTLSNYSGTIYIYELVNGQITFKASNNLPSANSDWTDLTAGDFDGDGIDEFICKRNVDGDFYMYKLKNGVITNVGHEYFTANQEIDNIGAGDFKGKGTDQLVCLRNVDGHILVFNVQGNCQSLEVDNFNFNSNDFGARDYHVQNTLTASNISISSPAQVEFTAGNKILLKTGFSSLTGSVFSAKIDQTGFLACGSNPNYRQPQPIQKEEEDNQGTGKWEYANIYPNPNNGIFSVEVPKIDSTQIIIHIYDIMGKIILSKEMINPKQQIDISNQPKGIYLVKVTIGDKVYNEKIVYQ